MKPIRAAAVSVENRIGRSDLALASMRRWTAAARDQGADLVLFPELNVTGYLRHAGMQRFAEPVPGPSTEAAIRIAATEGAVVCFGILERAGATVYCTQVLVNGDGILGRQRKIHVPAQEQPFWSAGSSIDVVDIGGARAGIALCRDAFFDELTRTLYFKGAEVVLMPFGYYNVPRDRYLRETIHGMSLVKACWTNGYYAVACNSAGNREPSEWEPDGARFPGWAGILSPWGRVLASVEDPGNGPALLIHDLLPDELEGRRSHPNFLAAELRPELYRFRAEACAEPVAPATSVDNG